MKITGLTCNLVEKTAEAAGYNLEEVCAVIPKGHNLEHEFYCACMGSSYRDSNWEEEAAARMAPVLKEAMESITPLEAAYNRFKHSEDMLNHGWTTQEEVEKAKKLYENLYSALL